MAINDPNYRYATQTWEADGVRTDYEIAFDGGYIRQSDVVAFSVAVDPETGLATDRTSHVLTFVNEEIDPETEWKTATVRITPAVPAGRRVVIYRSTEKSRGLVNFTARSIITEKNLDLMNDQAIFGIAEIMDGLQAARLDIDAQVQEVIDLNELTRHIYQQVLDLLASGGIVSVQPRVWRGEWSGDTATDLEFPLVGADVDTAGFYDTYVNGVGMEPDVDYEIIVGDTPADTRIRFTNLPAAGSDWFTVLRGYARPYTGPQPLVQADLRLRIRQSAASVYFLSPADEYGLVQCTASGGCAVEVPELQAVGSQLGTGSYLSIVQQGGPVTVYPGSGAVTIDVAADCAMATRGVGSVITLTCLDGDTNRWLLSGDLAKE